MPDPKANRNRILTLLGIAAVIGLLFLIDNSGSSKLVQAFALFSIWGIAAVSLNLVNGVTGILSLGQHGFMLIGGYVTALLILPVQSRIRIIESGRSSMTEETLSISIANFFSAIDRKSVV